MLNSLKYKPFLIKPNRQELSEIFETEVSAEADIEKYAKSIGYSPDKLNCGSGYETEKYFCSKKVPATIKADMDSLSDRNPGNYYEIVTKIDINIPIVRNVFTGISVFFVKGNTKVLNH